MIFVLLKFGLLLWILLFFHFQQYLQTGLVLAHVLCYIHQVETQQNQGLLFLLPSNSQVQLMNHKLYQNKFSFDAVVVSIWMSLCKCPSDFLTVGLAMPGYTCFAWTDFQYRIPLAASPSFYFSRILAYFFPSFSPTLVFITITLKYLSLWKYNCLTLAFIHNGEAAM